MNLVLYIISAVIYLVGFLRIKKSKNELSFIQWFTLGILSGMLLNAVLAGIYGLVGIPIQCITICIPVIILSVILLFKSKNVKQQYILPKSDIIFLTILVVIVALFWGGYFLFKLPVRYTSVDASVHCRYAKQIAFQHTISANLFFGYVNDGLLMEALLPITGAVGFYHSFTLARIFDLGLAGLSFYSIISVLGKNKYQKGLSIFLTFVYLFGYPLYAIVFGFVYFGDAITLLSGLIIVFAFYKNKEINHNLILVLCNLFLFGIFTTYTLFVPNIFLSAFLYVVIILISKTKKLVTKDNVVEILKIFVFPCVLGMAYAYVNLKEASSGGGISNEGGKYFDLYSNFIFLVPFVVSGLYRKFKNRDYSFLFILFIVTTLYTLLLFAGCWMGRVSTYYLSKLYNIIWLLMFIFLVEELHELSLNNRVLINGGIVVFLILGGFILVDADTEFSEKGMIRTGSSGLMNIYSFNKEYVFGQSLLQDREIAAFDEINTMTKDTESVLYIGNEVNANWFKTFTDQENIETSENIETIKTRIEENQYEYLFINSSQWEDNQDYFDSIAEVTYLDECEDETDIVIVKLSS